MNWMLKRDGKKLCTILTFEKNIDQTKVISTMYNGAYQAQTVGAARAFADIRIS